MKIGIIVTIIGNFGRKGFYQSQEIGLARELALLGHDVVVYKCISSKLIDVWNTEIYENIKVHYIPVKSMGPHGYLNPKYIEAGTKGILIFSDTQLCVPLLYKYCNKHNIVFVPYVGIAHSFQQNLKSKIMDRLFKIIILPVYKKNTVLVKTQAASNELKKMGVKSCIITPVGLDLSVLHQENVKYQDVIGMRKEFGFTFDNTIILFVARLQPEKKPLEMIDIFSKISNSKKQLIMVGKGPLESEVKSKIKALNLEKNVKLIPQVEYCNMWKLYAISDYFVNLREEEIFGMAIMEAVYYKCSVAAMSAPGPDTILNGMKAHKICADYNEIIDWISQDNHTRTSELENDRKKIITNYTWNKCATKFVEILDRKRGARHD